MRNDPNLVRCICGCGLGPQLGGSVLGRWTDDGSAFEVKRGPGGKRAHVMVRDGDIRCRFCGRWTAIRAPRGR